MNKQQLIKQITDKIVKSVPTKKELDARQVFDVFIPQQDITLEDVLIAIRDSGHYCYLSTFQTPSMTPELRVTGFGETNWQLGTPFHEQSIETLQFINDILQ